MSKTTHMIDGAIAVKTYEELRRFVEAFAAGHLNFMILMGGPGLAKSQMLRRAVGDRAFWVEGNATPFMVFRGLWEHLHQLVVIDDVDGFGNGAGVRLLKCLCNTDAEKTVAWHSAAALLDQENIPRTFSTRSKVALITNVWTTANANVSAVEDRGHVIVFKPSPAEVHREAGTFIRDTEIYEWFERQLPFLEELSLRHYVRAAELKRAGLNWKELVPLPTVSSKAMLVARLKADTRFPTEEARAQAFVDAGLGCRATYFNHARKIHPTAKPEGKAA